MKIIKTHFYGEEYSLAVEHYKYKNGQNAIQLTDNEDGSPFMTASVSVDDTLEEDEVAIKDYSENQGILDVLINNDVVGYPHRAITSGHVEILICKLKSHD